MGFPLLFWAFPCSPTLPRVYTPQLWHRTTQRVDVWPQVVHKAVSFLPLIHYPLIHQQAHKPTVSTSRKKKVMISRAQARTVQKMYVSCIV